MKSYIGYLVAGLGIVFIVLNSTLQKYLPMIPSKPPYILLVGAALVILGIVFMFSAGKKQEKEVPIYEGRKIVGYRRLK